MSDVMNNSHKTLCESRNDTAIPMVSVVVPNYNHARYLTQRIDSVMSQVMQNFEIIILDDASTDDSMSIIEKYLIDPRVRVIRNRTNSGSPFLQWNRGVREARGVYVWIAESDDYSDPRFIEQLVSRLESCPDAVMAYCDSYRVNSDGFVLEVYKDYFGKIDSKHWVKDFTRSGRDEIMNYLIRKNTIPNASAVLFKKKSYVQAGGASAELRLCGDWLMWIKMLMLGDLVYVSEPLNYFRCHSENVRSAVGGFILHKEEYLILKYIHKYIGIDRKQLCMTLNRIAAGCVDTLFEERCGERGAFREVYRAALLIDPCPVRRFMKYMLFHYPRKIVRASVKLAISIMNNSARKRVTQ